MKILLITETSRTPWRGSWKSERFGRQLQTLPRGTGDGAIGGLVGWLCGSPAAECMFCSTV